MRAALQARQLRPAQPRPVQPRPVRPRPVQPRPPRPPRRRRPLWDRRGGHAMTAGWGRYMSVSGAVRPCAHAAGASVGACADGAISRELFFSEAGPAEAVARWERYTCYVVGGAHSCCQRRNTTLCMLWVPSTSFLSAACLLHSTYVSRSYMLHAANPVHKSMRCACGRVS